MEVEAVEKFGISARLLQEYLDKIKNGDKIIAIAGEFSSGKSTFLNAFLDKKGFIPSSNMECTPVLLDIVQSNEENIEVTYKDNSYDVLENTYDNIKKYASNRDDYDKDIVSISIPVNSNYLLENTHIIDTPGSNTIYKEHSEITNSILRKSDIVLYIVKVSLSNVDLINIKNILNYSTQILFIVSHMDEKSGDIYVNSNEEIINKCVENVRENLISNLGIKNPDVLPIGSLSYYNDNSLMDEIRECVKFAIENNSQLIMKTRVKNQLNYIFKKKYDELVKEYEFMETVNKNSIDEIKNKQEVLEKKIKRYTDSNEKEIEDIKLRLEKYKEEAFKKISYMFQCEKDRILFDIEKESQITEEFLENEMLQCGENILLTYNKLIKKSLDKVIEYVYEDKNKLLKEMTSDLNLELSVDMHSPSLEEVDMSEIEYEMNKIESQKSEIVHQINMAEDEIAVAKEEIIILKDRINTYKDDEERVIEDRRKNIYSPEYDEVIEEGYADSGKRIGRFIGEAVDMALLFVNPTGGILKEVDKVKDGVKGFEYLKNSVKNISSKTKRTANKFSKNMKMGKELNKVLNVVDWLSVGKYGEIIGEAIGNAIKPEKTILVENLEKRSLWEQEMKDYDSKLKEIRRNQSELQDNISSGEISILQARRKKNEYETQIKNLEQLSAQRREMLEEEAKKTAKEKVLSYYRKELSNNFEDQEQVLINQFNNIISDFNYSIIQKSNIEFNKKIENINTNIRNILNEKKSIEDTLKEKETLINELKDYETWVDRWIG